MSIRELDQQYIAGTYGRYPVALVSGQGAVLQDEQGKRYIDLGSGIAVNTFGVSDPEWVHAVTRQLQTLQHTSNLYYTEPCARLAAELCRRTGFSKVFFSNSGAEANECAIKAARHYGETVLGAGHTTIITLHNSFHGRTITTLAATGQDVFHQHFLPLTGGFVHADPNDSSTLEQLIDAHDCCAIMLEVIQGEGGVHVLAPDVVAEIQRLADLHNLLIIVDDVQTGNGRTGKLYGYMNYDFKPDLVTTAKGLAGGLPMGATLFGERVKDLLGVGMHGSTFGGNPVAAAGALSILSRLDEACLSEVVAKGAYIRETLEGAAGVKSISGLGLMLGIESERPAGAVLQDCLEAGVLVLTAKDRVRLLPPLNIGWDELKKALEILKGVLAK